MKGIILIEGPDACGKTTLAKRLANDYNGIILHQTYRFKNNIPIYHLAVLRKAYKLSKEKLVIIDRLHLSEYIYAKVYRNGTKWPWILNTFNILCQKLNIPIICCCPSTLEQGLSWFEQAKQERVEMFDDIKEIIKEYINYCNIHPEIITYNREYNDTYDFYYDATKQIIEKELMRGKYEQSNKFSMD